MEQGVFPSSGNLFRPRVATYNATPILFIRSPKCDTLETRSWYCAELSSGFQVERTRIVAAVLRLDTCLHCRVKAAKTVFGDFGCW